LQQFLDLLAALSRRTAHEQQGCSVQQFASAVKFVWREGCRQLKRVDDGALTYVNTTVAANVN